MLKTVTGFILLLSALCFAQDQTLPKNDTVDYFRPDNVLKFADYLYENGEYLRAAGEFQRYLFSTSYSSSSDSIYYRMIKALYSGKDYSRCSQLFDSFGNRYPDSPLRAEIPIFKSIIEFKQGNYTRSLSLADSSSDTMTDLKRIVMAMDYLYLGRYAAAGAVTCFDSIVAGGQIKPENPEYRQMIRHLCDKSDQASSIKFKSRIKAGIFSAMIPGAGKIYAGRVADGLYSFILIGLLGWQSYEGFSDHGVNSAGGWIFGTLGAGFYLSNIYGTTLAADLQNQKRRAEFLSGLKIEINLP